MRKSLYDLGAGRSIVLDKHRRIIAGNKTAEQAGKAGISRVIVVRTDGTELVAVQRTDLDLEHDDRAKLLAVADNRAGELGLDWDADVLKALNDEVDLSGLFDAVELTELITVTAGGVIENEDEAPDAPALAVSKPGDLYQLGKHRLLCGDATKADDVARLMGTVKADMVFTDPPYGIGVRMNNPGTICKGKIAGDETTAVAVAAFRLCASLNIPMIFWGANHYTADAQLPNAKCWICWDKQEAENHIDQADCEFAWSNIDQPARVFRHLWSGFRRDSEKGERRVHPTQKPVALIEAIFAQMKAGRVVLDLFGGSGSTLIACEKTGRACRAMEIDPTFVDVIVTRWEAFTGLTAKRERYAP